jgi:hypothetical protein
MTFLNTAVIMTRCRYNINKLECINQVKRKNELQNETNVVFCKK